MANYEKIAQTRPAMADFLANQRKIGLRGDVLTYWPNTSTASFSTDSAGFRHSNFAGKTYSVSDCLKSDRFGILLGASTCFGFGIAGNENTGASVGAEQLGFPIANASMPGANSRNLHSLLVGLLSGARSRPAVVIFSNDGDLGGFCSSGLADPIFGSPNIAQQKSVQKDGPSADADKNFPNLLSFSMIWAGAIARLCRAGGIPLVMVAQESFLEKKKPTSQELDWGLGEAAYRWQEPLFANHRKFNQPFFAHRRKIAETLGIALVGTGEELTYIDEFHADEEGTRLASKAICDRISEILAGAKSSEREVEPAA